MLQNLSSAAAVIGALRVNDFFFSKTYYCWKCLKKINSINDVRLII